MSSSQLFDKIKSRAISTVFAVSLLSAMNGNAAIFEFSGSAHGAASLIIGGTLGFHSRGLSVNANALTVDVTIDDVAETMKYDKVCLITQASTVTFTESVTTGLGQSTPYTVTLSFNPQSLDFVNSGTQSIVPLLSGDYTFGRRNGTDILVNYSGTYMVTNGTDTRNGSFSFPSTGRITLDEGRIITDSFPSSILVASGWRGDFWEASVTSANPTIFSENFGGTEIEITFREADFGLGYPTTAVRLYSEFQPAIGQWQEHRALGWLVRLSDSVYYSPTLGNICLDTFDSSWGFLYDTESDSPWIWTGAQNSFPWVYHHEYGWVYAELFPEYGLYFYSESLGWFKVRD